MAPNHLSVREMREDEKPLVLEMLKVRGRPGAPVSMRSSLGPFKVGSTSPAHLPDPRGSSKVCVWGIFASADFNWSLYSSAFSLLTPQLPFFKKQLEGCRGCCPRLLTCIQPHLPVPK